MPEDAFEVQAMLLRDRKVSIILDVGANQGQTVVKYRTLFPDAQIYSFEPFPACFAELERRHGGESRVKLLNLAVADACSQRVFYVNNSSNGSGVNSLFPLHPAVSKYYAKLTRAIDEIQVPVVAVDEFCRSEYVSHVDILKMDIQGGELLALQGAAGMLSENHIALIYTEVFFRPCYEGAAMFHEQCDFLSRFGYTLYNLYDLTYADNGQLCWCDAIFVSEQIRKEVIENIG